MASQVPNLPAYVGASQPGRSPIYVRAVAQALEPFDPLVRRITPATAGALVEDAKRVAGLTDLGPGEVVEPLQVLIDTLRNDPRVSALGRLGWTRILRDLLVSRLRVVDHINRHPDVHQVQVERPIIILGLPRTGTTLLYYLLSAHPGARPLMGWESFNPVPPPPGARDRRPQQYARHVWGIDKLVPAMRRIHELDASKPDEGLELMDRTMHSINFMLYAFDYVQYLMELPDSRFIESWELFHWQLQLLQQQRMNDFWVLKAPGYIGAFGALDKYLPDARYVVAHRDLRETLPSAMSLLTVVGTSMRRPGYQPLLTDFIDLFVDRIRLVRRQVSERPSVEVLYPDLVADPGAQARRVFEVLDEPVPDDFDERVATVLRGNPQHKNGPHRYHLEQFGFDPADLEPIAREFDAEVGLDPLGGEVPGGPDYP